MWPAAYLATLGFAAHMTRHTLRAVSSRGVLWFELREVLLAPASAPLEPQLTQGHAARRIHTSCLSFSAQEQTGYPESNANGAEKFTLVWKAMTRQEQLSSVLSFSTRGLTARWAASGGMCCLPSDRAPRDGTKWASLSAAQPALPLLLASCLDPKHQQPHHPASVSPSSMAGCQSPQARQSTSSWAPCYYTLMSFLFADRR